MIDQEPSKKPRIVGYIRVSTSEQSLDLQIAALDEAGVPQEFVFRDVESGRGMKKREGLRNALKCCRPGGSLVVWKLDRLGRNTSELIRTVDRLKERGVNFRSLTQSEINTDKMETATGQLIFNLFAALAQFESDQISERTKAGQKIAKEKGVKFGRKPFSELYIETGIVENFKRLRHKGGYTIKAACKELEIPMTTYQKWKEVFNEETIDDIGGDAR